MIYNSNVIIKKSSNLLSLSFQRNRHLLIPHLGLDIFGILVFLLWILYYVALVVIESKTQYLFTVTMLWLGISINFYIFYSVYSLYKIFKEEEINRKHLANKVIFHGNVVSPYGKLDEENA